MYRRRDIEKEVSIYERKEESRGRNKREKESYTRLCTVKIHTTFQLPGQPFGLAGRTLPVKGDPFPSRRQLDTTIPGDFSAPPWRGVGER